MLLKCAAQCLRSARLHGMRCAAVHHVSQLRGLLQLGIAVLVCKKAWGIMLVVLPM